MPKILPTRIPLSLARSPGSPANWNQIADAPQKAKPYAISRAGHRVSVFAMARKRDDRDDGRRLLTVDQLADLWQVSPRTIRLMIKNGKIPMIRIGRAVRIHPRDTER